MSKPIKLTPDMIEECVNEFRTKLTSMQMFDGKLKYETTYEYRKEKDASGKEIPDVATVVFSKLAWEKQKKLIDGFSSEVAWNGICRRDQDDPSTFYIDDIIVFPQQVTGSTVTPNQKEYELWLMKLPQEQFDHCRYHGHSHVNMTTSPSVVDDGCQQDILGRLYGDGFAEEDREKIMEQLGDSAFYIFMIWNKRGEHTARIYDTWTNTYYDGKDVLIDVEGGDELADFMAEAKAKVTTKTPSYTQPTNKYGYYQTQKYGQIGFQDDDDDHRKFPYTQKDIKDWYDYHRS